MDSLVSAIHGNWHGRQESALLYLNLRSFAQINYRYGNAFGDRVLEAYKRLMVEILYERGTLYHMNADEFFCLIDRGDFQAAYTYVHEHRQSISEVNLNVDDEFVHFHVFCGLVRLTKAEEARDMLYRIRDSFKEVMKLSKEDFFVYREIDHLNNIQVRKFKNKRLVEAAIRENRIIPYFQPIVNLQTDGVEKQEVLMRILEEDKVLSPYRYVRVAEEFNLIEEMDFAVFRKSVDLLASSKEEVNLSFNLSGKLLANEYYLARLNRYLLEKRVPPCRVTLEITETEYVGDLNNLEEILSKYKRLGFTFAIDDFGTGFSSMHYLQRLPVDYVKIDGVFIKELHQSEADRHLVRSLVHMAKAYGIRTIAEFVESEEVISTVRELGIDYGQGYYLGKPQACWSLNFPNDC